MKKISVHIKRMKAVLDLVKAGPHGFTDLFDEAKKFEGDMAVKHNEQLTRILKSLEYLGEVLKNEEGKYVYSHNVQTYDTYGQYQFLMDHSEKLMEGNKRLQLELLGRGLKGVWDAKPVITAKHIRETLKLNLDNDERYGTDPYRFNKPALGLLEKRLGQFFCEHLQTGYPETHDSLITWYNGWKKLQGYIYELPIKMGKILPDSEEYTDMEIIKSVIEDVETSSLDPESELDAKTMVSSEIIMALKRPLMFGPPLTKIPYKKEPYGLKIGPLRLDMSEGLAHEVIEVLPDFSSVLDTISEWNRYEAAVINLINEVTQALIEIEVSVRGGKPMKGVCSICRDVIVKQED